ncbi:MAG: hypothetical protein U1E62_00715 [Alsobacter sp.]
MDRPTRADRQDEPETQAGGDPEARLSLRGAISQALSNGEAWRFKDLVAQLRQDGTESEIYKELRALIRAGSVRRVRHGVYLAAGPYDWSAPIEAEAGVPVIQSAIFSQLHRLRTVDELRTVLGLPREVVWRSLRALIQSGAVCTGEPQGVFREMTFIRRDQAARPGASAPAGAEEEVDRLILSCVSPGPLYSAHAVAAHADILVRAVKLSLRKLSTLGTVRCFAFDDGLYFYLTADHAEPVPPDRAPVRAVDVSAELGAVNIATLSVIADADQGIAAVEIDRRLESLFRGSRNTAARIITKLRRSGLVQMREGLGNGGTTWEATDIGVDVVAIAQADSFGAPAAPASPADPPHVRLARWIIDTVSRRDGARRRRVPINKRILARSLNVPRAELDASLQRFETAGLRLDGTDLVVPEAVTLEQLLAS